MIGSKLGVVIAMVVGGLLTNFVSAGSDSDTTREDMSGAYLELLPDESIKSLSDWCIAHTGEPVSTNPIIDVPNYVSCDEVKLDELSRGFEKFADTAEQKLKDYCDGTLPPEEKQKLSTLFPNIDCNKVKK